MFSSYFQEHYLGKDLFIVVFLIIFLSVGPAYSCNSREKSRTCIIINIMSESSSVRHGREKIITTTQYS